jgi:thiol-disulfide isomerase/thioredoxin
LNEPQLISFEEQQVLKDYNWKLIGLTGKSFNLLVKTNNVVVVKYFSISDELCNAEMETFNAVYEEFKTKIDFIVVTNEDQLKVKQYLEKEGYLFPVFYSLSEPPFIIEPQNNIYKSIVVSRKGRIVVDNNFAVNWDCDEIRDILNGLIK